MPLAATADGGLIEAYDNLVTANPAQSHMKRAKALNRIIPKIVEDLDIEHPSIGFYIAPGNENRLEVTNDGEGAMVARFACYSARGENLETSDWLEVTTEKSQSHECVQDKAWIFVEWNSELPAAGKATEHRLTEKQ